MLWHIIVFSIIFALCGIEAWQIVKLTKYVKHLEGRVDKHQEAILNLLRGF